MARPLEVMPDAEADLVLAVNEAATNVIDHAYRAPGDQGVVEVFFWTEPGAVSSRSSITAAGARLTRTPAA